MRNTIACKVKPAVRAPGRFGRRSRLLLLAAVPLLAAGAPSDRMARIERGLRPAVTIEGDAPWTLEERMRHYEVPAVSVAVIQDFEVVAYRVYGVADRETGEKASGDTLFQAGSVSKPVAAFGALKMVAGGKLTLDGDINDTLKSWKLPDNEFTEEAKVTLTHLLAHTGGLTVHGFPGYAVGEDVPTTVQVLDGSGPANTPPIRVDKVPGEGYRYSGGGYTIAQLMMVDAAGKPFPELMEELVLKPVGMERSTFLNPLPPKWLKHAAAGYLPDHSAVEGKRHTYPEMAAAGLWTTAEDLARFAIEVQLALRGESDVLDRATAEKLVEPVTDGYGRGFGLSRRDRAPYFGHGGWDEGFCASLTAHRTAGYGAVVMINSNHPQLAEEIIRGIAEEYGWAGYAPYPKLEMQQAALELYPGRYRYNAEQAFTIERCGGRLFMQYAGGEEEELSNVGDGRYVRRERPTPITFTVEDSVATFHFVLDDGSRQTHQRMADDERAPREILVAEGFEKALPVYRALFEQSHDDPAISERWLNGQGLNMADEERYEPAIGLLRIATELYPDSANTYDSVGYVYREMGEIDRALQWYRKALEVDPEFPSAVKAVVELEAERESNEMGAGKSSLADGEKSANTITIRALIDGSDVVKVRGDTMWYEHLNHAVPGAWVGDDDHSGDEPTVVNGVEWVPQWDGKTSEAFTAAGGLLPAARAVTVTAVAVSARGKVAVLAQPSEKNDYTLSVMLDDDPQDGAEWYEVQLRW
jgi:CubicO group peptidase (beta-lactamase class C family)